MHGKAVLLKGKYGVLGMLGLWHNSSPERHKIDKENDNNGV